MADAWQKRLKTAVSPLDAGAAVLRVQAFRRAKTVVQRPGRTAAVLVGIIDGAQPEILLTRRAQHLKNHAGQVSFPGGAAEQGGESGVITALREAKEEIGLPPEAVEPIGFLDRVDTISDFRVLPVVGLVSHQGPWTLDRREVDEVFTLPLECAIDLDGYQRREIVRAGTRHVVYSLEWRDHLIWGVTAAILRNLAKRILA